MSTFKNIALALFHPTIGVVNVQRVQLENKNGEDKFKRRSLLSCARMN